MPYCVIADVETLNSKRGPYTESTKPNIAQVTSMIERVSLEIDAMMMKWGFAVPINMSTSPQTYNFLAHLNALGAAGLADASMFPEKVEPGGTSHSSLLMKEYQRILKFIDDAKGVVSPDAETSLTSVLTSYPVVNTDGEVVNPNFSILDDNW